MSVGKDLVDGQLHLDHLTRLKRREVKRPTWGERQECRKMPDLPFPFGCYGFTITTGSEKGTDLLARQLAEENRMRVEIVSPAGSAEGLSCERTLTCEEKERGRVRLAKAARHLKRYLPKEGTSHEEEVLVNYALMAKATAVFVFAKFLRSVYGDKGEEMRTEDMTQVCGKRAWLVQLVIDHNRDFPDQKKKLFVFDEFDDRWLQLVSPLEDEEVEGRTPNDVAISPFYFTAVNRDYVTLDWHSTVVGSRKLHDVPRRVLRNLFCLTVDEFFKRRSYLLSPYDEWVVKLLYDNSKMERGPEPPKEYPEEPPECEGDGNPFPWMFVRGIGFVRRRPNKDQWDDRTFRPGGTGEWDWFYGNPEVDDRPEVEQGHAMTFWWGRVESYEAWRCQKTNKKGSLLSLAIQYPDCFVDLDDDDESVNPPSKPCSLM